MDVFDSYQFGRVVIGGRSYTLDVVIYPDRVEDNWYLKVGHQG